MSLPPNVQAVLIKMYEKFGDLNKGDEDSRRKWTRMACEQLVYTFGIGSGWGHKASGPNHPPSKDTIARKEKDGRLFAWDVINGATRELVPEGMFHDITGQHFIPVSPVNHLGTAPEPIPDPTPVPDPTSCECKDDLRRVAEELERIGRVVTEQTAGFTKLAQQVAQLQVSVNKPRKVTGKVNARFLSGGSIDAQVE